ncbi:hypothetical protein ACFS5M_08970 [Lacinutrix iliipiscaria]|uniref:Collagen triple helix repeat-containing protein n=1 Tax=Lacinutrix iliipiscaria TaxID=1230532 RepID=A0ABW5WNK1_9FLAO
MKNITTVFLVLFISFTSFAQNGINYKAVVKDNSGNVIANDLIVVEFTIHSTSAVGPTVYQESHTPNTDDNGLIIINIGEGNPLSGVFNDIDWAANLHFLNVQINTGDGLQDMGTTEFKAVPYALSAPDTSKWEDNGNGIHRLNGNVGIGTANPARKLHVISDDQTITTYFQNNYAGSGSKYGIYNYTTSDGTGTRYGLYNNVSSNDATSPTYGIYNTLSTAGASGNMYGVYSYISASGTGNHYALYGYASGPGNYGIYAYNNDEQGYAAYFNGRTQISDRLMIGTDSHGRTGLNVNQKDLYVRNADTTTVRTRYSGAGTGGETEYYMNSGFRTLELQASETASTGSQIQMYKADGSLGISLDADFLGLGRVITQEIEVTGADLAEFYAVSNASQAKPGMILCLDPNKPGEMMVSNQPYDKKVAGIISGANGIRPAILMGGEMTSDESALSQENRYATSDGKHPLALTGKVYVYADASNGSIEVGDLLTSSTTPGYAMKVTEYSRAQGAIVGKAMSSLPSGQGFVLVLVNLQ